MRANASARGMIAMVTPGYPPDTGGIEQHVAQLAPRLVDLGFTIDILTHGKLANVQRETIGNLRILRFPLTVRARHYRASVPMWRYLRTQGKRYDAIHAHNYHALPALFAATSPQGAFVLTPHYHGESASRARQALHHAYKIMGHRMIGRAARIICVSGSEAELVKRHFPAASGRISVIPNGVDTAHLAAAMPFDGYEGRLVLTVGRLDGYKRVDRTLEALAILPSMVLHVVGEGEARPSLEQRAATLGIAERVRFLGRVSDQELANWYKTASVVISLSEHEAFGMVAAEALAAGVPVVLSDIPAHHDMADMGSPARVRIVAHEAGTAEIAAAIQAAIGAASTVSHVPDWTEVAQRTAQVYDAVLHDGSRP
jgi:glycosyltransferase involved in cell wall biosynthesis